MLVIFCRKPRTPVLNICYRILQHGHKSNAVFRINVTIIFTTIVKSLSLEFPTEFQIERLRLFVALLTFSASDLYCLTVLGILDNGTRKDILSLHIFCPVYSSWKPVCSVGLWRRLTKVPLVCPCAWFRCDGHHQLIVPRGTVALIESVLE
jgi:hypothetical protein